MMGDLPEEAGKVATSAVDAFKSQPGLLFLTLVNVAFLVFVYFIGSLVLSAYREDQGRMSERYTQALKTVDRCINAGLGRLEEEAHAPLPPQHDEERKP